MTDALPDSSVPAGSTGQPPTRSAAPAASPAAQEATPGSPVGRPAWSWSGRNLSAIAALSLGLLVLVIWRWQAAPAAINDDLTVTSIAVPPVAERINPNTATWASLARLPGIGPSHAKAIIAYRQAFVAAHGGEPAFAGAADLDNVAGIGAKTIEGIVAYLEFPALAALPAPAASEPAPSR